MKELLELAKVYRMPAGNVIRYIYIPYILGLITGKTGENRGHNSDN